MSSTEPCNCDQALGLMEKLAKADQLLDQSSKICMMIFNHKSTAELLKESEKFIMDMENYRRSK